MNVPDASHDWTFAAFRSLVDGVLLALILWMTTGFVVAQEPAAPPATQERPRPQSAEGVEGAGIVAGAGDRAAAGPEWIGKRVIQKYRQFQLKVEDRVIDRRHEILTYRVKKVDGPWLWLEAEGLGLAGWAMAEQVVPVEEAIVFFTRYIREFPDDVHGFFMRAIIWYQERNEPELALDDLNDAIRLDPTAAYLWNDRGEVWRARKNYNKAIGDYTEAIRLAPDRPGPYNNRGLALYALKDYEKAIADYTEAIRLDPKNSLTFGNRGNARLARKDYAGALADYEQAIDLDPKFVSAYRNRARALLLDRRGALAVESARKGIKVGAWEGEMPVYTAIIGHLSALQVGDSASAKWFLDEAAAHADHETWPYAVISYLRGELSEASLLAKAGENINHRTEAHGFLGYERLLKGREEEALRHFVWVKEHGDSTRAGYMIAMAELDRLEAKQVSSRRS